MAKADTQTIGVPLNPLMKEETRVYVDQQKRADYLKNISQYLFWGATTVMAALAVLFVSGSGAVTTVTAAGAVANVTGVAGMALAGLTGPVVLGIGIALSAATFLGSVMFSNRATELSEKSAVLYSDIDSQNQAHRMVQAFAKAQSTEQAPAHAAQADIPFELPQRTWVEKTGRGAQAEHAHGGWADRITAQAHAEDAHALAELKGRTI